MHLKLPGISPALGANKVTLIIIACIHPTRLLHLTLNLFSIKSSPNYFWDNPGGSCELTNKSSQMFLHIAQAPLSLEHKARFQANLPPLRARKPPGEQSKLVGKARLASDHLHCLITEIAPSGRMRSEPDNFLSPCLCVSSLGRCKAMS